MHYICPKCWFEESLYAVAINGCSKCGCTRLFFLHIGTYRKPSHWVLVDTETGERVGPDMCNPDSIFEPIEIIHDTGPR